MDDKRLRMKEIKIKLTILFIGIIIMSFGIAMYLKAGLGGNPLTTLTQGFSKTFGISVGKSTRIIMLSALIAIFFIEKEHIGIGTILNLMFTGYFIDIFLKIDIPNTTIESKIIILSIAVFCFSTGLAMYVVAGLGAGAIDSIMIIIRDKMRINMKKARITLDIILVGLGGLLGGDIGVGTIFGALFTARIMIRVIKLLTFYLDEEFGLPL